MPSVISPGFARSVKYFCASAAIMIAQPTMHRLMHRQNQAASGSGYAGADTPEISNQPNNQYQPSTNRKALMPPPIVTFCCQAGSGKATSFRIQTSP